MLRLLGRQGRRKHQWPDRRWPAGDAAVAAARPGVGAPEDGTARNAAAAPAAAPGWLGRGPLPGQARSESSLPNALSELRGGWPVTAVGGRGFAAGAAPGGPGRPLDGPAPLAPLQHRASRLGWTSHEPASSSSSSSSSSSGNDGSGGIGGCPSWARGFAAAPRPPGPSDARGPAAPGPPAGDDAGAAGAPGAACGADGRPAPAPAPAPAADEPPPPPPVTWVDRAFPPAAVPYAKLIRLDAPVGTWLLAWPCFWSIAIAAPAGSLPDPHLLALFGAGALVLRGAGCTINDLWDRELDARVARTRHRPLASGAVSPAQALLFLGAQLSIGLGILLQLNDFSKLLGASSLLLVGTYPLMKRITHWPQAFLGLTFNWGALLGYAAVHGALDLNVVLPLYLGGAAWTLVYDTIYAHQDKVDDKAVGIRSTALTFGDSTPQVLAGFSAASLLALAAAGNAAGLAWPHYVGLAAGGAHLAWQVGTAKLDDRADCAAKFRASGWYGAAVCGGIVAGKLLAVPG